MHDGLLLVLLLVGAAFLILLLMAWMRREMLEIMKRYVKRSALNPGVLPASEPYLPYLWQPSELADVDAIIHAGDHNDCPDNLLPEPRSAVQQVLDGDYSDFVDRLARGDVDLTDPDQAAAAWMLDEDDEDVL